MTKTKLKELMKKHCIVSSEIESAFDFVSELLYCRRKELEQKESYATRTIASIEIAEHEVWDLIDYISELEEE